MASLLTRFSEAAVVREHKTEIIKVVFYNHWISRHVAPTTLTSDNSNHPVSSTDKWNGRVHSTLKAMNLADQLSNRDCVLNITTCLLFSISFKKGTSVEVITWSTKYIINGQRRASKCIEAHNSTN